MNIMDAEAKKPPSRFRIPSADELKRPDESNMGLTSFKPGGLDIHGCQKGRQEETTSTGLDGGSRGQTDRKGKGEVAHSGGVMGGDHESAALAEALEVKRFC